MPNEITTKEDWYENLLEDLKRLEFTGIVLTKWNIGNRIKDDFEKFGKPEYGSKRIENLAKDLKGSAREIQRCLQFSTKYPELTNEIRKLSWHQIANNILPERTETASQVTPSLPEGEFNVILADCPWKYNDQQDTPMLGGALKHYPVMTIDQLCNMPLPTISRDAVLFFWVTSPMLFESKKVIDAWGFDYKTSFVWDKVKHNMGHYNSVRHEFLLICTKGSMTPEVKTLYDSVIQEERTPEHSEKPKIVYKMIETLYPSGKGLEMFNRGGPYSKYWTVMGNEVESDISTTPLTTVQ